MTDQRKKPKQAANFGLNIKDLTTHGGYTFLTHGTHKCRNCILAHSNKCAIIGKSINYKGQVLSVGPNTECPIIHAYVESITTNLMAESHIDERDILIVNQLARLLGFIAISYKYLNEIGMYKVDTKKLNIDVQPLVNTLIRYESMIAKLFEQLALTPKSRISLGIDKKNRKTFADMIVESGIGEGNEDSAD